MSRLIAMAVPILKGKEEEWHQFVKELNEMRFEDFQESRKKLGVHERTFYQQTPEGGLVLVTLEGEEPELALQKFMQGTDDFTKWFLQKIQSTHGIDFSNAQPPLGKLLIDSGAVAEKAKSAAV